MTIQELKHRVQAIRQYPACGETFWAKRRLRIQLVIELGLMGKEVKYSGGARSVTVRVPSDGKEIGKFSIETHIGELFRQGHFDLECGCCGSPEVEIRDLTDDGCESGIHIYCGSCNYVWQYED